MNGICSDMNIAENDFFEYNVIALLESISNAVKFLLCPVCKKNTVCLEPFKTVNTSDLLDKCADLITFKCQSCVAPISVLNCILKKEQVDKDKNQVSSSF